MNTDNNTCKTIGCGDLQQHHDNDTGKCNVQGCECEHFVGKVTCPFTWLNTTTNETYSCQEDEGHKFHHDDKDGHTWYTDGNPAQPEFPPTSHAPLCVNQHPSSTFERMGGSVEINSPCTCSLAEDVPSLYCPVHRSTPPCEFPCWTQQDFYKMRNEVTEKYIQPRPCIRSKGHTGKCSPVPLGKFDYEVARAGARKALGSSPLKNGDRSSIYGEQKLPIETAVNEHWNSVVKPLSEKDILGESGPVRFVQIVAAQPYSGLTNLFALDSDGQLWARGLSTDGKWVLDTMPVR